MRRQNYLTTCLASPVDPYRALLGSSLVAMWDARLGVTLVGGEVDAWRDQIAGIALNAPSASERPTYLVDGTNFRGRPVVGIVDATSKRVATLSAPSLIPLGSKPELLVVGRLVSLPSGSKFIVRIVPGDFAERVVALLTQGTDLVVEMYLENILIPAGGSTSPCVVEAIYASVHTVAKDGVTIATGGSDATGVPMQIVTFGGNGVGSPGSSQDANLAAVMLINPAPAAATRTQLLSMISRDWATPAPP